MREIAKGTSPKYSRVISWILICAVWVCLFGTSVICAAGPQTGQRSGGGPVSGESAGTGLSSNQAAGTGSSSNKANGSGSSSKEEDIGTDTEKSQSLASMTEKQLSSISMLNHMTVLSQEINSSSNSRLYLDNAYSDIVNNINPNAIDENSMTQIRILLDSIYEHQSMEAKRERLKYIYEQNQADTIKRVVKDVFAESGSPGIPGSIFDLIPIVNMAVDAAASYKTYLNELDEMYLEEGWVLDDSAAESLHESRREAFTYMVEMCQKQGLDGMYALNEKSVENFVDWENNPNPTRRIDYLEKNQQTYQMYGKYWLVLAESYYEKEDYADCLDALDTYEDLHIDIFRKDHGLAKASAMAIAAADEVYTPNRYVFVAEHYLDLIKENVEPEDWMLRYFAAQAYTDLYGRTNRKIYLQDAYDLLETNVNYLIDIQREKNQEYLKEVISEKAKKNATREEKKEVKSYNKWLKEERKVALPPVYQPLVVNCDLLFMLAKELDVPDAERQKIQEILYEGNQPLFLTEPLNNLYLAADKKTDVSTPDIRFDGRTFFIPVSLLEQETSLRVTITDKESSETFEDWKVRKVERGSEGEIETFSAVYESKTFGRQKYTEDSTVLLEILPPEESSYDSMQFTFKPVFSKRLGVIRRVSFEMQE